eukprot:5290589-Alexandrium_andersonii.AAC.1
MGPDEATDFRQSSGHRNLGGTPLAGLARAVPRILAGAQTDLARRSRQLHEPAAGRASERTWKSKQGWATLEVAPVPARGGRYERGVRAATLPGDRGPTGIPRSIKMLAKAIEDEKDEAAGLRSLARARGRANSLGPGGAPLGPSSRLARHFLPVKAR